MGDARLEAAFAGKPGSHRLIVHRWIVEHARTRMTCVPPDL